MDLANHHTLFDVASWRQGVSTEEWETVLRADPCAYCGGAGGTIDHIIPLKSTEKGVRGRSSAKINGTGSCQRCNAHKGHLKLIEFLNRRAWEIVSNEAREREETRTMARSFFTPEQIELMIRAC